MLSVRLLVVCILFVTSQAQYKCRNVDLKRQSCGRLRRDSCELRGCCYDETEPSPWYKCSRSVQGLSLSFQATKSPALNFGGEPGYPGNKLKRGCFPLFRNVKCDVKSNAMRRSTCERWGCCWDEAKSFCHKSLYNIIRLRKKCPPGFVSAPGCRVSRCKDLPCLNGGTCSDVSDGGYECQCPPRSYGTNCENQCIPPVVLNGDTSAPNQTHMDGDSIHYVCATNYRLVGNPTLTCAMGIWSPAPPTCALKNCPTPPTFTDGSFAPTQTSYKIGDSVDYSCDLGFTLIGFGTATCTDFTPFEEFGSWGPLPIGCGYDAAGTDCLSLPCLNGGFCLGKPPPVRFECTCQPCCTGRTCDIPISG